jgi:hypothetical protein
MTSDIRIFRNLLLFLFLSFLNIPAIEATNNIIFDENNGAGLGVSYKYQLNNLSFSIADYLISDTSSNLLYEASFIDLSMIFDKYNHDKINFATSFLLSDLGFGIGYIGGPQKLAYAVMLISNGEIHKRITQSTIDVFIGNSIYPFVFRSNKWISDVVNLGLDFHREWPSYSKTSFGSIISKNINRISFKLSIYASRTWLFFEPTSETSLFNTGINLGIYYHGGKINITKEERINGSPKR